MARAAISSLQLVHIGIIGKLSEPFERRMPQLAVLRPGSILDLSDKERFGEDLYPHHDCLKPTHRCANPSSTS